MPWNSSSSSNRPVCTIAFERTFERVSGFGIPSDFPFWRVHIVGFCNGLLCFTNYGNEKGTFFSPKVARNSDNFSCSLGFAYDSEINDYKVVKISTSFLPLDAVEVYTLSLDSWRMVKISWATFPAIFENNGNYLPTPLVSGALHWMALDLKGENNGVIIMSFDVNSERFRKLALLDAFMDAYLYSSKSCLALFMEKLASITSRITEGLYFQYSIWVMREYGVWLSLGIKFFFYHMKHCLIVLPLPSVVHF